MDRNKNCLIVISISLLSCLSCKKDDLKNSCMDLVQVADLVGKYEGQHLSVTEIDGQLPDTTLVENILILIEADTGDCVSISFNSFDIDLCLPLLDRWDSNGFSDSYFIGGTTSYSGTSYSYICEQRRFTASFLYGQWMSPVKTTDIYTGKKD